MEDVIPADIEVYCRECGLWIRAEAVMPSKGPHQRFLRVPLHKEPYKGKRWCGKSKMSITPSWWETRKNENTSEHGTVQENP